ncbi:MAG: phospho-N-acetylmuramoyl-pentapeptide-transferase [Candidatus Wildermuthbacteria bacterium]|nr:phospho-N-acetylmuramoyl-pentapeptide-transferase [Candidatus Wildermuthbacteria bacterium]
MNFPAPDLTLFFFASAFILTVLASPLLIIVLKQFGVVRKDERDLSFLIGERKEKRGTPIMGGLIIVFTVTFLTLFFNWHRETTYVPIGVLLLSALLGGADDLLNIFYARPRPVRTVGRILRLIRTHQTAWKRVEYAITLPWHAYKRFFYLLGSHPGHGIQAHEKIIVQFIIGAIVAWWIVFKIEWIEIWIPWAGHLVFLPFLLVPIIIFLVMFMANAVNITDGIDGLSAGTLTLAYAAFFVIAIQQQNVEMTLLIATVIGALIGYLLFNIKPAKYQMGDVASLGLGVLLTAIAFALDRAFLLPIVGAIFFIEIGAVLLQSAWKILFGKRLFLMAPLHHHFEMKGWSEATIVMYAWTIGGLFSVLAIWLSFH